MVECWAAIAMATLSLTVFADPAKRSVCVSPQAGDEAAANAFATYFSNITVRRATACIDAPNVSFERRAGEAVVMRITFPNKQNLERRLPWLKSSELALNQLASLGRVFDPHRVIAPGRYNLV